MKPTPFLSSIPQKEWRVTTAECLSDAGYACFLMAWTDPASQGNWN